jgi:hypothetical protein
LPGAADEEPQADNDVPMPIAAIVRNMAELPTARPIEVRKSRRAIRSWLEVINSPSRNLRNKSGHQEMTLLPGWTR